MQPSYWVASDHFVELGEATSLLHGGFGLLTIGNLRKPRFWALAILERLGGEELEAEVARIRPGHPLGDVAAESSRCARGLTV